MAEATFGEQLAEARRMRNETIEDVSDQLRIRPSIILAMETSNFSHMPHKGYARNMVSSYARYLGLDSTRLTEQFLREFRQFEGTGRRGSGTHASNFTLASQRSTGQSGQLFDLEDKTADRETITAARRNIERSSLWGTNNTHDTDKRFREQLRQRQSDNEMAQALPPRRPTPVKRRNEAPAADSRQIRSNDYVGKPPKKPLFSGVSSNITGRPVLLIAGLVAAFLAILILWAFLASTCSQGEATTNPVPHVGATDQGLDADQTSSNSEKIQAQIEEDNRYGPFEVRIQVAGGQSWLQIDVDGATPVGEVVSDGWSQTFTITSTFKITTGAPSYVKVFKNDVEVPLDDAGSLELKVEVRPIVQNAQTADAESQE